MCEKRAVDGGVPDEQSVAPYRILSLDGGGTWALIQVHALIHLFGGERADVTGHKVLEHFNLVIGTSGGSIVAAALAANMPLKNIAALFETESARRSIFQELPFCGIRRRMPVPRYRMKGKRVGLSEHLGDLANTTLAAWHEQHQHQFLPHLVITGFDYDSNRAAFFRSNMASRSASTSRTAQPQATFLDAVHASTNAAVKFFDRPTEVGSPEGLLRYWDGAIGGNNNPAMAGVVEAVANGVCPGRIKVLSLGTGGVRLPRRPTTTSSPMTCFVDQRRSCLTRDLEKLAGAILDDPPDAASFVAHVMLGGRLPTDSEKVVTAGPIVRMSPVIRPVHLKNGAWQWPGGLKEGDWLKLVHLDMDAVKDDDVKLIKKLCDAWLNNKAPNQPIRANDSLEADIGHDKYAEAAKAALGIISPPQTASSSIADARGAASPQ